MTTPTPSLTRFFLGGPLMRTPTTRSALRAADEADPVTAVVRAWTNPGNHPAWHDRAVRVVRRAMPMLAHALDRLAANPPKEKP